MKLITALDVRDRLRTVLDADCRQACDLAARKKRLVRVAKKMDAWRVRHARSIGHLDTTKIIRQIRAGSPAKEKSWSTK
jgi:hypothetical protein